MVFFVGLFQLRMFCDSVILKCYDLICQKEPTTISPSFPCSNYKQEMTECCPCLRGGERG